MRPIHEEEWEDDGQGSVWNKGRLADLVHVPTDGHAQSEDEVFWRGRLISAAPDMARALLAMLEWDKRSRECPEAAGLHPHEQMRAALRKAGVIP